MPGKSTYILVCCLTINKLSLGQNPGNLFNRFSCQNEMHNETHFEINIVKNTKLPYEL